MRFSKDERGQVNIIPLVVSVLVGTILLIVYFQIYEELNKDALDSTALLLVGLFGTVLALVLFIGVINVLR